jgi:hypothetical protein
MRRAGQEGRRESNPDADFCNQCNGLQLEHSDSSRAAPAQHLAVTEGHCVAANGTAGPSIPATVCRIADAWPELPPHIREAIFTLVDAGLCGAQRDRLPDESTDAQRGDLGALASELARQCRNVVQGCLREEKWPDADEEFCRVITNGLAIL